MVSLYRANCDHVGILFVPHPSFQKHHLHVSKWQTSHLGKTFQFGVFIIVEHLPVGANGFSF